MKHFILSLLFVFLLLAPSFAGIQISFQAEPTQGGTPLVVDLVAYATGTQEIEIVSVTWMVSGKQPVTLLLLKPSATTGKLAWQAWFDKPGEYEITLRINDAEGKHHYASKRILVGRKYARKER